MSLNTKVLVIALYFGLLMLAVNAMTPDTSSFLGGVMRGRELGEARECKREYVSITQGPMGSLPSGSPLYSVQILNQCASNCKIAQLHLNCGPFTSEKFVPPSIFKRVANNDCLVNNGNPIGFGSAVSFQYANSHQFPLQVSSLQCF
ncbi:TPD1 protein-like protein 1-like [Senna tora]|uniref:TPD1 protein-like protein 1-like n=1 Tax=Senna tora TaxID=362788 RepID=A0A835CF83_9FABA|nr:TPD1 protein-like protein 1-like [Senna tora]